MNICTLNISSYHQMGKKFISYRKIVFQIMLKRQPVGEMDTEEDIETGLKSEGNFKSILNVMMLIIE